MSEYADDITIYAIGCDLTEVTNLVQTQIDKFLQWTRDWGLIINPIKTKAMLFTRNKASPLSLNVENTLIEFVNSHKFLGMTLDAPGLMWKAHINKLRNACLPRLNLL